MPEKWVSNSLRQLLRSSISFYKVKVTERQIYEANTMEDLKEIVQATLDLSLIIITEKEK